MKKLNLFSKLKKLNIVKGRDEKRSLQLTRKLQWSMSTTLQFFLVDIDHCTHLVMKIAVNIDSCTLLGGRRYAALFHLVDVDRLQFSSWSMLLTLSMLVDAV